MNFKYFIEYFLPFILRSTRADYNLPNKTKTDLYVRIFGDSKLAQEVGNYSDFLVTSAYAKEVAVVEKDGVIPEGCAIVTVSDKCTAHLMLKGIIDPSKEVEKVQKKQDLLKNQLEKLKKSMQIKDYETKVPEEVRKSNSEKLSQMETEIVRLGEAMLFLKAMWKIHHNLFTFFDDFSFLWKVCFVLSHFNFTR